MRAAPDLEAMLNMMPPAGRAVLPALSNYLAALGSDTSLMNAATMNTGYLAQALYAVQHPSVPNGGIKTDGGTVRPAYSVATSVADIRAGLDGAEKKFELKMSLERLKGNEYKVTPVGKSSFSTSAARFLSVTAAESSAEALQIATRSAPAEVRMNFSGVTTVYFGPVSYDMSSGRSWYWMKPIIDAIKNGTSDVSGFKFSPDPQIDFSSKGPFGFLTGVAISKHPVITVKARGPGSVEIANQLESLPAKNLDVKFLGEPLLAPGSLTGYSRTTEATSDSVDVRFDPLADTEVTDPTDRTAFVHGVQALFPAA